MDTSELRNFTFFEDFSESELAALASIGTPSDWMEGEILFQKGSPAKHIYILKSGMVLLCFPDGRSFPMDKEGEAIGWSALVSPFRYTATARCLTNVTLYQFPGGEVYRLLQMDANFGYRLMQKISQIMEERKPYKRPGKSRK